MVYNEVFERRKKKWTQLVIDKLYKILKLTMRFLCYWIRLIVVAPVILLFLGYFERIGIETNYLKWYFALEVISTTVLSPHFDQRRGMELKIIC